MKLSVITPERVVLEIDDVEAVYAKAADGEVGILPHHVPLVTPLEFGVLRFVKAGKKEPLAVMGGLLHTDGETVSILCDAAELASEIDSLRAKQALERAEARLKQTTDPGVDLVRAKRALVRSQVRLKLTQSPSLAAH